MNFLVARDEAAAVHVDATEELLVYDARSDPLLLVVLEEHLRPVVACGTVF